MQSSGIPLKLQIPFANGASAPYVRAIPQASQIGIQNGAASLTDGFPPLCFQPESAGGVPPFGEDFNGILFEITQWTRWQSAGAPVFYDAAFSAAVGGYPKWATLSQVANPGFVWVSTVENNTSNPDAGGANWYSTRNQLVGGALSGTLPNPGLAPGAAALNVGPLSGSLIGLLPSPSIANSGVAAGSYVGSAITVGADGRVTAAANAAYPTYTPLNSGAGATFNVPAGAKRLKIRMVGGGGSGAILGSSGVDGGQSAFGLTTALGGKGATTSAISGGLGGGPGSTAGGAIEIIRVPGGQGGPPSLTFQVGSGGGATTITAPGGCGGNSPFFGGGGQPISSVATPASGTANTGGGGAGQARNGSSPGPYQSEPGGGSGEYVEFVINNPAVSYVYTVGNGGVAPGGAGNGGSGLILVEVNYD